MNTTSRQDELTPCVVLGAGVAGHAAMVWLRSYGARARWLAPQGAVGGMLHDVYNKLLNVPGCDYPHGAALAEAMRAQLDTGGLEPPEALTALELEDAGDHLRIRCEAQHAVIRAQSVIVATGTRHRRLHVPGITGHDARATTRDSASLSVSASRDGARFAGREVAVVGGGDAAFENALILARHGCRVHLLMRSAPRARQRFMERVQQESAITVWPHPAEIVHATSQPVGLSLEVRTPGQETLHTLEVAGLFMRIGVEPVTPALCATLDAHLQRDAEGYWVTDAAQCAGSERLFAAGDVTHHPLRSIVNAAASGATAALGVATLLGIYDR